jgi:hypothetical protein
VYCSEISHAVITANVGFKNSDGCKENPSNPIQRLAPFISSPNNRTQIKNRRQVTYPIIANRLIYRAWKKEVITIMNTPIGITIKCCLKKWKGGNPSLMTTAGVEAMLTHAPIDIMATTIKAEILSIDNHHLLINFRT